jgi:hypothetical protein
MRSAPLYNVTVEAPDRVRNLPKGLDAVARIVNAVSYRATLPTVILALGLFFTPPVSNVIDATINTVTSLVSVNIAIGGHGTRMCPGQVIMAETLSVRSPMGAIKKRFKTVQ